MSVFWLALGGALGALTRFGLAEAVRSWTRLPGFVAVFVANVLGTALLAVAHFSIGNTDIVPPAVWAFTALGYCGALTTYSAFGLDTVLLWYEGRRGVAVAQFVATLLCGAGVLQLVGRTLAIAP